jgi:hypothetical protein
MHKKSVAGDSEGFAGAKVSVPKISAGVVGLADALQVWRVQQVEHHNGEWHENVSRQINGWTMSHQTWRRLMPDAMLLAAAD